jgi:hypothetical protein
MDDKRRERRDRIRLAGFDPDADPKEEFDCDHNWVGPTGVCVACGLKWYSDPPFGVPLLTVVQPEPPRCTAWVEIGNGRQICTRESGHKGVHSSGTSGVTNWNRPDVLWETGP